VTFQEFEVAQEVFVDWRQFVSCY